MQITDILLKTYSRVNKSGILKTRIGSFLFDSAYFVYKKYYEDPFHGLLKKYPTLTGSGHILDIGANIGYTAILFSRSLEKDKMVHAFEPEKNNFEKLRAKINAAALSDKVLTIQTLVGEKDGELELWLNDGNPADHRVATTTLKAALGGSDRVTTIRSMRVDTYVFDQHISDDVSFIKLDVQGYESQVIDGMQSVLQSNREVVLVLEYSPQDMYALGYDSEVLLDRLNALGFRLYQIGKGSNLADLDLNTLKSLTDKRGYCDIVCSRKNLL